jgi:hypothetical protein
MIGDRRRSDGWDENSKRLKFLIDQQAQLRLAYDQRLYWRQALKAVPLLKVKMCLPVKDQLAQMRSFMLALRAFDEI